MRAEWLSLREHIARSVPDDHNSQPDRQNHLRQDPGERSKQGGTMNEIWLGTIPLFELFILAAGCWFYMWGGRSGKWKRRFIGSFICATAAWVGLLLMGRFKFLTLAAYPLLAIGFSLGYGADRLLTRVGQRFIIVVTTALTGVVMGLALGGSAWIVLPLQVFIGLGSMWLGLKNPIQAAAEEFFVCLLLTECLAMYPFITTIVK